MDEEVSRAFAAFLEVLRVKHDLDYDRWHNFSCVFRLKDQGDVVLSVVTDANLVPGAWVKDTMQ